ncbi:Bcr/CflA family efflux MFS transporter [Kineosporia sp. R_H_3]|uniref:Bcr/CflA family efflux MFS transporter n=1 Tax=Kineosporia sp. R_H_3 TaxID=1961848 RepID=UPI00117A492A|nr:Bcr/CflA family efflux MFS transporter [Kineosporia sp. R_H_3]
MLKSAPGPLDPAHRRALVVVLGALAGLAPLCTDLYLPVLPQLAKDLAAPTSQAQLTITAVLLGLATGQVVAGPLSDRFGRRPLLLGGLLAFVVANLVSAVVDDVTVLVVVRLLAGLAASATVVTTRAVIADAFPAAEAARGYAALAAVMGIAPIAAPLAGGLLTYVTGWRGMFVVLAAIGALLAAVAHVRIPETLAVGDRRPARPRDVAAGLVDCLRSRRFVAYMAAIGFSGGLLFTYIASSSFVLQDLHGLSARQYSLDFAANATGILALVFVSRHLVTRTGPGPLLRAGQAVAAAGALVLLASELLGGSLIGVLVGFFLAVSSVGLIHSNATALGMAAAPGGAGAASGMLGIMGFAVGSLVAPLGGLGGSGLAMAVVMAACALLAPTVTTVLLRRPA